MNQEPAIIEAVVAAFTESRPAAIPASVSIQRAVTQNEAQRPWLLVRCEGGAMIHPRLYQGELVLELECRKEDVADDAAFDTMAKAIEPALLERGLTIKSKLAAAGFALSHLMPVAPSAEPGEVDGYLSVRRWSIRVRGA